MTQIPMTDLTRSYLPILFVVAIVGGALTLGMAVQNWTSAPALISERVSSLELQRKQDMQEIGQQFKSLTSSLDELRKAITDPLNSRLPVDLVRQTDLEVFCLKLQVLNPTTSFKCPLS